MPHSDISEIISLLVKSDAGAEPRLLLDLLVDFFRKIQGDDIVIAEKKAANRLARYSKAIQVQLADWETKGIEPFFSYDAINKELKWSHLDLIAGDNHAARWQKIRLRKRPEVVRQIHALSDNEFERLVVALGRFARVRQVHVTPRSNDFGIDAIALVDNFSSFGLFKRSDLLHKVIIQAKKYDHAVSRDKVQVMCNTLSLVRARSSKLQNLVPDWFWSAEGTISGWILGNDGFQSGSIDHARDNGILLSDTWELAHLICTSRNFDPVGSVSLTSMMA